MKESDRAWSDYAAWLTWMQEHITTESEGEWFAELDPVEKAELYFLMCQWREK